MSLSKVLTEGRKEDFLKKFRKKFSDEEIKKIFLLSRDISPNHKFLNFIGKVAPREELEDNLMQIKIAIEKFIKYQDNLEEKDINKYDSLNDIKDAISKHENKIRREVKTIDDADVVYEDDRFTVVCPLNHKASCYYGAGSKWCTASRISDEHFLNYNKDGKLFYFLDKKAKTDNNFYKVALLQKYSGQQTFFDAEDKPFKNGWIIDTEYFGKIYDNITRYLETKYSREIEIFKDEVKAKQELERLNQIQNRERMARMERLANERREEDSWNLQNPEIDDVGIMANAVFDGLVNLWDIVGEGEDVYYLHQSPFEYFGLKHFNWKGETDNDSDYVVGTYEESYDAAKEKLKELIQDVGGVMSAFNKDFVLNYIDKESVIEFFRESYTDMVYDDPSSYFESDEYPLSKKQQENIERLSQEKEGIVRRMEEGGEEEDLQERIDEIDEEIERIQSDPDGDVTDDMVEEKVNDMIIDVKRNIEYYMNEYGLNYEDYIDEESLLSSAIDADGLGHTISQYDAEEYEVVINNVTYHVFRTS